MRADHGEGGAMEALSFAWEQLESVQRAFPPRLSSDDGFTSSNFGTALISVNADEAGRFISCSPPASTANEKFCPKSSTDGGTRRNDRTNFRALFGPRFVPTPRMLQFMRTLLYCVGTGRPVLLVGEAGSGRTCALRVLHRLWAFGFARRRRKVPSRDAQVLALSSVAGSGATSRTAAAPAVEGGEEGGIVELYLDASTDAKALLGGNPWKLHPSGVLWGSNNSRCAS
eukprot:GHVU01187128.1.p1 GENE.GHVU01187128.1~~GHVU01187128.1.p1  ORF type:complete len:228 (+),score=16.85 GHVU01187128.1:1091-1774(+)